MRAIYDSRIYNVVDVAGDLILETNGQEKFTVDLGDDRLIADPTDQEVADANNLADYYGVSDECDTALRSMLRGQISLEEWQLRKIPRG